jgi:hypothetical protein
LCHRSVLMVAVFVDLPTVSLFCTVINSNVRCDWYVNIIMEKALKLFQ